MGSSVFFFTHGLSVFTLNRYIELRLAYNSGVAFSLFADYGEHARILLILSMLLFILLLLVFLYYGACRHFSADRMLGISLFIGGAIGNLYDRAIHGAVVDFISCHIGAYYWPTFNVADICISFGFLLSVLSSRSQVRSA